MLNPTPTQAKQVLARLFGWTYHNEEERTGPRCRSPEGTWHFRYPRWTTESHAAMCLALDLNIIFGMDKERRIAGAGVPDSGVFVEASLDDFHDPYDAVRYCIVLVAIQVLESK